MSAAPPAAKLAGAALTWGAAWSPAAVQNTILHEAPGRVGPVADVHAGVAHLRKELGS